MHTSMYIRKSSTPTHTHESQRLWPRTSSVICARRRNVCAVVAVLLDEFVQSVSAEKQAEAAAAMFVANQVQA